MNRTETAPAIARAFLDLMEAREIERARTLLAPDFIAIYPGGRRFTQLEELVASGARRYRFVRKQHERQYHLPADGDGIETVIFYGTLSGEWMPDGEAFHSIRFTDRFRLRDGRIIEQQVWNDIGEALLLRAAPR